MLHRSQSAFFNSRTAIVLAGTALWCVACQRQGAPPDSGLASVQGVASVGTTGTEAGAPSSDSSASATMSAVEAVTPVADHSAHASHTAAPSEITDSSQVQLAQTTAPGRVPATSGGPAEVRRPATPPETESQPEPLLKDWQQPLLAIVLTGEQHGYLEPCGCSERQSGGLARRADFVRQLQERGWNVAGFDLGGTLKRSRRQSEMKLDYTRNALNIMGYKVLGLGPEELKLGVLKLFEAYSQTQADDGFDVPFVSANVTFFGTRDVGTPLEYRIVEVNGVKIGVTSILGESFRKEMYPPGTEPDPTEIRIDAVDDVLPGVIARMQAEMGPAGDQPQIMLLLSHAKQEESREIARKYPQFDLVVTAGSPEDPDGRVEKVGNTLFLKVGAKGKHAGLVGLYPGTQFRFTTVELDRFRFGHAPSIDNLMEQYQQLLAEENLVANEPSVRHAFGEGYEYLGSEKCGECHDAEYEIWKGTPHSHAFDSLTVAYAQASDDPTLKMRVRVDRIHDPECINCHTVGWDPQEVVRFDSGFTGVQTTPHLLGVGCENCHGPGSKHVALEESGADEAVLLSERQKLHLSVDTAEVKLCIKCHDYENSPDFDFSTYWPQIEH